MARDLGEVGSGGGSGVRGDSHAARIGGVAGVGQSPVERQQGIERLVTRATETVGGQTAVVVKAGDLSATSPMSLPSNQHTGGSGA
jgi:hypothetical protein